MKSKSAVNDEDYSLLNSIDNSLEPLQLTTNALCRNDATLLSADAALECLLSSLQDNTDRLSVDLYEALTKRILERRNPNLTNLMKYLQNKDIDGMDDFFTQKTIHKKELQKMANSFFKRLSIEEKLNANSDGEDEQDSSTEKEKQISLSFEEKLQKALLGASSSSRPTQKDQAGLSSLTNLTNDFKLYEAQNKRTPNLEFLYNALLTIKPTSVESERAFSAGGGFATKIRSRLNDNTLSALVGLRKHFNELKKKD